MANIKKRGKKFIYVYDDPKTPWIMDPNTGEKRRNQVYASFDTKDEAEVFKAELEVKKLKGTSISPSKETVADFIPRWVAVYAPNNWQPSTYDSSVGMLNNHVIPALGHYRLQKVTPLIIETFITSLRTKRCLGPKSYNKPIEEIPFLSSTTIREVYDLVKKIFDKAVEWNIIDKTPVVCKRPKKGRSTRKAWTKNQVRIAFDAVEPALLKLSMHLAFFCSLRNGETMAITMDCIDMNDGAFGAITVNKTLQRVSKKALKEIPPDELLFVFPEKKPDCKSILILKEPKTDDSTRKVFMTSETRRLVLERMAEIEKEKAFYGQDYHDFNLLFALPLGNPVEPKLNEKWFTKWQKRSGLDLPEIVFHELRHTSITYKVFVSGGDIKNVGAGAGQSSVQTTEGYNHSFEENQKDIMRKVEEDFWGDAATVDSDKPLECDEIITLELLQSIAEDCLGFELATPYEFDSPEEYAMYLFEEMSKKKRRALA